MDKDVAKVRRFLKKKVAQYYYLIVLSPTPKLPVSYPPYKAKFYSTFAGMGANAGSIALCSAERRDVEFNMKKVMWNAENLPGLEALVVHEVCHIIIPGHGPVFEKIFRKYAGDLAPALGTLIKSKIRGKIVYFKEVD